MAEKAVDLVCGMKIDKREAVSTSEHQGKSYYFCSEGCKKKFDQNPENYVEEKQTGCC